MAWVNAAHTIKDVNIRQYRQNSVTPAAGKEHVSLSKSVICIFAVCAWLIDMTPGVCTIQPNLRYIISCRLVKI